MKFEQTRLWQDAFAVRKNDPHAGERARLAAAYQNFWKNGLILAAQISKELPTLTLHDEAHFTALWERADQIAGVETKLSPLEAFAFGGAILLHDAANSSAAFQGGLKEIQSTPEWKDSESSVSTDGSPLTADQSQFVLLSTLRALHAREAEKIAGYKVRRPGADDDVHLLADDQLRSHLGPLIGQIAASHHWPIEQLERKLPIVGGALAGMPADWSFRPIRIACLLRTADAVQLDQSRAPDFLYGLLQLRGVSELHWRSQNRIATPSPDPSHPDAFIFSSTRPFDEDDAQAWWIAFDAIQVANRELQASDNLLKDLQIKPFAISRVRDATSPLRLSQHVQARGWKPVPAKVFVSDVDRVVEMFGGEALYGADPSVAVRELIQNSADAISQRRLLEGTESTYRGSVTVRIKPGSFGEASGTWLRIEDDGLGMSEATLTGPLIDFGSSYIGSAVAAAERPGLQSVVRKRRGRFGVGFFSAFMITEVLLITSRPFDEGLDAAKTLSFRNGLRERPILLESRTADIGHSVSTRVSAFLSREGLENLLSLELSSHPTTRVPLTLAELIGAICLTLDVDVYVQIDQSARELIHSQDWFSGDKKAWLRRALLADARKSKRLDSLIERLWVGLELIDANDPSAGMAVIDPTNFSWGAQNGGIVAVSGLSPALAFRGGGPRVQGCLGVMGAEPSGPKRESGQLTLRKLEPWANRQALRLAAEASLSNQEAIYGSVQVASFGGDPMPIAQVFLNRRPVKLPGIVDKLLAGGEVFVVVGTRMNKILSVSDLRVRSRTDSEPLGEDEIEFQVEAIEALSAYSHTPTSYFAVPTDANPAKNSFLGCLDRNLREQGWRLEVESVDELIFGRYTGLASEREGIQEGVDLVSQALKLRSAKVLHG